MNLCIEPYPLRGSVTAPTTPRGEGNWRLGAHWLAAGALGGVIRVENLSPESAQPEVVALPLLERFGAELDRRGDAIRATHRPLCAPRVIDLGACTALLPIIAVIASFARVTTEIRVQIGEADRMRRLRDMLVKLGGIARYTESSLFIRGSTLRGGVADTTSDPALTMAAAIAGSVCAGPVLIANAECVRELYPDFFGDYRRLGGRFTLSDRRQ